MKLKLYLKQCGLTREQFADKCGTTKQTLYNVINKKHSHCMRTLTKIVEGSGGIVTMQDLLD